MTPTSESKAQRQQQSSKAGRCAIALIFCIQTSSRRTVVAPIAVSDASKNVAENVPRLILFAFEASVSFNPCLSSRSANFGHCTEIAHDCRERFRVNQEEVDQVGVRLVRMFGTRTLYLKFRDRLNLDRRRGTKKAAN